jgi:2-oxoglutarate dehydrogenase E2 component (dihydrolipoamide succinyltransferase)
VRQEIRVPSVGESVTQGILAAWLKADGDRVEEGGDLYELETDKATVTVPSPASGVLSISVSAGTEVTIGQVVGSVETGAEAPVVSAAEAGTVARAASAPAATPAPKPTTPLPAAVQPSAGPNIAGPLIASPPIHGPPADRVPMSTIRKRTAERLLDAQRRTASLTTFNEIDMERVMEIRSRYRDEFERLHGVKLGLLSFFVKACCRALAEFPVVNARIEGEEIVYNKSMDIGVAVSTDRGLLVPVVRNADRLSFAQLESAIADLAARAREKKILPDELAGGTFSITNGGVFGSLLSTPLLNFPQSAILGMHAIQRRPIADGDRVVIHPMMYVALTYDHRLIDGREAVSFLVRVKQLVEDPVRLFLEA